MNNLAANLRRLRLEKKLTQEQLADQLSVSAQSVSRWENNATFPDVMLLPELAHIFGVLVDDLFKPAPAGYENFAHRLLAVYEHTHRPEDFLAASTEFEKLINAGNATADDWRSYGVTHEYMTDYCIKKAIGSYDQAMAIARATDQEMYHRVLRQKNQLRCRIGQAEACIKEQEAAVAAAPDHAEEWVDLADAYFMAGQPEAALRICEEALERFPEEGLLHLIAGDSCRVLKRYDEAFVHWESAIRIDDKFLDAMFSMAFCRWELGQFDKAAAIWEDIVRRLTERGLDVEAQWPREMAEKCLTKAHKDV